MHRNLQAAAKMNYLTTRKSLLPFSLALEKHTDKYLLVLSCSNMLFFRFKLLIDKVRKYI